MGTAPVRKRMRIPGMDYRYPGPYFVTVCAAGRAMRFGEVRDSRMHRNAAGDLVLEAWLSLPDWNPWVHLDVFEVMPNHVHGILAIGTDGDPPAAPRPVLGRVIARFKARSTAAIRRIGGVPGAPVWQRGFYESIIRNGRGWDAIRDYIRANPAMWDRDAENPRRTR